MASTAVNESSQREGAERTIQAEAMAVLPIRGTILFPELIVPLLVEKEGSKKLVDDALVDTRHIVLVGQKNQNQEEPAAEDLYSVGTAGSILKMLKMPNGDYNILVKGVKRVRVEAYVQLAPYLKARVSPIEETPETGKEIDAMVLNIRRLFQRVAELAPQIPTELGVMVINIEDPSTLTDLISSNLGLAIDERQKLLETVGLKNRLENLSVSLNRVLESLELSQEIQSKIKAGMEKNQREYILREQLKAIQRELGEGDERTVELDGLKKRVKETEMSPEAKEAAEKELDRLSRMSPAAAEYTVSRTYLDWLVDLPWSKSTTDNLDIRNAQTVLDEDHYDLEKVKKRILEYLAVRKLKADTKGPILCFVGPPGVGKTSLGQSIARAMGRKFVRLSLGGVHDEAEIRGHRRTYVGALPGRIIQGIKKAGSSNPVFMIDEVDKIGMDFRGDPASALLEVLDPEQNFSFSDHYLDVAFDLSKVMFITTANILETIPRPLQDRMEVLELPGYTEDDKLMIAQKYLVPRQLEAHGLSKDLLSFQEEAIRMIIASYTREAGVRNLEREIAAICRGVAKDVASGKKEPTHIDKGKVTQFLGNVKFFPEMAARTWGPGLATGLAWTPAGGDILFIEASSMKGNKNLTLTGHLGDVMKESAIAALTYIRSHVKDFGVSDTFFDKKDIHIHVPAGAIPKDGPSAGVAILVALASLVMNRPVRKDVAMTGEITLRGDVLPVGGIKEKVLAAKRAGLKMVILPRLNEKDVEEIPEKVRNGIEFRFVHRMEEAIEDAIENHAPAHESKATA